MFQTSVKYKEAIEQPSKETKITGVLTCTNGAVINIDNETIGQGTLKVDNSCVSGEEYEIGSVYAGRLRMTLLTDIDRYTLFDGEIKLSFWLKVDATTFEEVPLGVFYVAEAFRVGKSVEITAYDAMLKADKTIPMTSTGTPFELLEMGANISGIELAQTESEINDISPRYISNDIMIFHTNDRLHSSFRDLFSDIAKTLCGFATIDRFGKLKVLRFGDDETTINENIRKKTGVSDFGVKYDGLKAKMGSEVYEKGANSGVVFEVGSPFWDTGTEEAKETLAAFVWDVIKSVHYIPSEVTTTGDPSIDLGDKITYTGGDLETDVASYVMRSDWDYRGPHRIDAVGKNPKIPSVKTETEKRIEEAEASIIENKLKLITFISITNHQVGEITRPIVELEIESGEDQTVMFNGQALLKVTKPGTFKVVYRLNGQDVPFSPAQVITYEGDHIFPLFYPIHGFQSNIANRWQVDIFSNDGEAEIDAGDVAVTLLGTNAKGAKGFSGLVYIEEDVGLMGTNQNNLLPISDAIDITLQAPMPKGFTETVSLFSTGVQVLGFSDIIDVDIDID